jgi:hypothetical protein
MTDPFRPALRVRYGEAAARVRPLDRDVFVLAARPAATSGWIRPRWRRSTPP